MPREGWGPPKSALNSESYSLSKGKGPASRGHDPLDKEKGKISDSVDSLLSYVSDYSPSGPFKKAIEKSKKYFKIK